VPAEVPCGAAQWVADRGAEDGAEANDIDTSLRRTRKANIVYVARFPTGHE